ncbi:MAG: DUF5916 domain-containing protein [Candidatus Aminicenantes bacterium]|jgi:hypothetical protein
MKRYVRAFIVFLLVLFTCGLAANEDGFTEIPLTDSPPHIDGKMDETVWATAVRFQGFKTLKPDYGKPPSEKTVIYACSDRENIYFAARCFQKDPSQIKASMTNRDNMFGDDFVAVFLDTFADHQSANAFLVNPLGIQGDGTVNSYGSLDNSRDMVWDSKGTIDDRGYVVELKIPFKSIRFPQKKEVKMRLLFIRQIVRTSENVSFPEIFPDKGAILSQTQGILVRDIKYKRILELLPALTHSRTRALDSGEWEEEDLQTDFSFTGKLGLSPSIVLDATYNPDFSQVEADAGQVDVNLRYALFYQEKRPFFLEGIEEFQFAGNTDDAPLQAIVHTRTIIDPVLGLKLTGKMGRKTSFSSIFAIDKPLDVYGQSDNSRATFGILRFRHAIKKDTYIGGFFTAREVSGGHNRVTGIDGRLRISGFTSAEYHLLGSFTKNPLTEDTNSGHALGLRYSYETRSLLFDIGLQDISKDFQVDTGYLTRKGLTRLAGIAKYRFYPKTKFFQSIDTFYWSYHILDKESNLFETLNLFALQINMPRSSVLRIVLGFSNEVFAGKRFNTNSIWFRGLSQLTKQLYFHLYYQHGRSIFYDPNNPFPGRSNLAYLTLQYQPVEKFSTSLDLAYEDFYRHSDSQKVYDYTILRSLTSFQLNKYLFFRGILEYNFFREELFLDFLASFTYIPGTVIHMGYGSVLEKTRWDKDIGANVSTNRFREIHRAFFFKVSYLWRL